LSHTRHMATIQKRGETWRAMIRRKGQSLSATFDTEAEARAWAAIEEARIAAGTALAHVKEAPSGMPLQALLDRYSREVSPHKDGGRWEQIRLLLIGRSPMLQVAAVEVDSALVAKWRDARLKEVSASTVNRELNLLSAVFTRAIREWRLPITLNPVRQIQRPKQPHARARRVSDAERAAILAKLGWDGVSQPASIEQWTAFAFALALETMMRQGEILRLTWQHVHLDKRYVHLPKTKNGTPRDVPLSSQAMALIRGLKEREKADRVVPVSAGTLGAYFRQAVKDVGIRDLHFHDSRRESLTRLSKKLSVIELARSSGHKDTRALMGYYRPDVTDLAEKLD